MISPVTRQLVEKERVRRGGKLYYKLYFYDPQEGVVIQVLAPVAAKEIVITNENIENAI